MTEERKIYILTIAKYAILTGKSTRELAKIFKVSNFTIHAVLTKYLYQLCVEENSEVYFNLYKEVQQVLEQNKVKTVDDAEVKTRVLNTTKMFLDGQKISEIAEKLNVGFYTVYRDLVFRLPKINSVDEDVINEVKKIMKNNKEINLEIGSKLPVPEEKRDSKGRFA